MPRGGGIGIVAGTVGGVLLAQFLQLSQVSVPSLIFLLLGGGLALLGWLDDRYHLSAKLRLGMQTFIVIVLVVLVGSYAIIFVPGWGVITLSLWLGGVLTVIWIVAFTNQFNFMDGIDGIAGIQAVVASAGWCLIFVIDGQHELALIAGLVAVTSISFLLFNLAPARIFMGDSGSTFLGYALAILPVLAHAQTLNPRLPLASVMMVAPFVFDSTITILHRLLRHKNVLEAHRDHLYQRLLDAGMKTERITKFYGLLAIASLCLATILYKGSDSAAATAFGVTVLIHVMFVGFVILWLRKRSRS
jgi:UDP-N-acetylmuramyl pentapeptide phosphotransferase/UDP-N-acetylglucosamine-1-phosphate transferase